MAALRPNRDISTAGRTNSDGGATLYTYLADSSHHIAGSRKTVNARPNIMIIGVDDAHARWIGGVDGRQIATRQTIQNRILSKGVNFTACEGDINACAPSRATWTSGLKSWNSGLANEVDIDQYDWTKTYWKDAYGAPGRRTGQTCHTGKVVNQWGKSTGLIPLPGAFTNMLPALDEAYLFYNEPSRSSGFDATLTPASTTVSSGTIAFTAQDEGKVITANVSGIPRQTYIHVVNSTTATMSAAFTGTATAVAKITLPGGNEQQKNGYASWEGQCAADGTITSQHQFVSDYTQTDSATFDAYATDYQRVRSTAFLTAACNRADGDARKGLPIFLTCSPIAGHTPFQDPPVYAGDPTSRQARKDAYFVSRWTTDIYDTRMAGADAGCTPAAVGFTSTGTVSTTTFGDLAGCPTVTDNGSPGWTVDRWVGAKVVMGSAFGVVLHNTASMLVLGEWLGSASMDAHFSYSTTSAPSNGSYTLTIASAAIDQTNAVGSSDNATNLQGTTGPFGADPGDNIIDERRTGKEMIAVDDMLEEWCAYLESLPAGSQYHLNNWVIIYTADNGLIRGESDIWVDKGYPPRQNFLVPFAIRWTAGGIPAGVTSNVHCCSADIYPTVMSFLGIPVTVRRGNTLVGGGSAAFDGADLSPGLLGTGAYPTTRAIIYNSARPSVGVTRGVRTNHYRYYHTATPPSVTAPGKTVSADQIYNWKRDPLELRNLWSDAEVGAGTGIGGGAASIRGDLVAMATAYDGNQAGHAGAVPPGTVAALTYPV